MKISIVIPTYNSEKYLDKAIKSIIDQNYANYEIIVIDGGSKDSTLEILEHYSQVLKQKLIWVSERDKGEPDAVNKGMCMVTGDIVAYLDSDDVYEIGCFDKVNRYFENTEIMWVYGKCKIINELDKESRGIVTKFKELFQPHYAYSTLQIFDYIAQPSVFWRKEVIDSIGFLDIDSKLAFDYDYWLRIGNKYKAGFINKYLASWRSHTTSETAKALSADMKQGLDLSIKYSPRKIWLRPFQYGVYFLSLIGYKVMGAL